MYSFDYERPSGIDNAAAAVGEDDRFLAGGQSLLPALKLRLAQVDKLVDLGGIADLKGITVTDSEVVIGSMTTHAAVASSAEVQKAIPALASLAAHIGDAQVRNRGTLGGSIANNDPAADYPAALVGLGATVHTNKRTLPAETFFVDLMETALEDGELITKVSFPIPKKAGYAKFPNPASRFALVGVFVAQTGSGARVAVTGAGPCVFRQSDMEAALAGTFASSAVTGVKTDATGLNADIHASSDYRAHLVSVMAGRAVDAAS
ncbi:FAD binding domain-containing protein [Sneathiella chinensis]|uniref:Carbon monoxide dehydrogenase n=1 Tax=Sneathiella chinensis TaxID=349750 RepID=A0ABQ5U6R8_9PROT|nr:xanthine dehydrogenase family protein subunit M [Sneathiella chinensis]GLQ07086.1 carbon monoxide dehydrogenase [Sneathiella chinensis]